MATKTNTKKTKSPLECSREVMNYSSIELTDRFDKPKFDGEKLLEKLYINSPKLLTLLEKIRQLDKKDYTKDKKLYKHFIFSDIKKGYGAKIIASVLIAAGYELVMKNEKTKILLDYDKIKSNNESKFGLLSSTALWNNPVTLNNTKEILSVFNSRSTKNEGGNEHGEKIRIIILDSGFKEGIDLFDVKYAHIFEDQLTQADLTQALGRVTRFCGQKGLKFVNNKGWGIDAFIYKLYIPIPRDIKKLRFLEGKNNILDFIKNQNKELQFNINFEKEISDVIKDNAVDKLLNEKINSYGSKKQWSTVSKIIIPIASIISVGTAGLFSYRFLKNRKIKKQNNPDTILKKYHL